MVTWSPTRSRRTTWWRSPRRRRSDSEELLWYPHEPALRRQTPSRVWIWIWGRRATAWMQVHAGRWIDSVHQRSRDHAGNRNAHSKSWPTNVGFDESPSGCDFTLKLRNSSHPGVVSHTTRSRESPNEEESMIDSDFANAHGFWI